MKIEVRRQVLPSSSNNDNLSALRFRLISVTDQIIIEILK